MKMNLNCKQNLSLPRLATNSGLLASEKWVSGALNSNGKSGFGSGMKKDLVLNNKNTLI